MTERKLGHKICEDRVEVLIFIEFVMIVERILEISISTNFLIHFFEDIGLGWLDELH